MAIGEKLSARKYWAFISYSSKDRKWGQWLHKRLENYPIPEQFRGTTLFDGAVLGKSLRPVFRDRDELSGSADLGPAILKALAETRYLIVLCSRNSAKSEWVNKEIEDFKAMGRERQILALILDGVPNATSMPGMDPGEECFPPALRYPAEPLAGDLRKEGDGKERGFLKILSGVAQLDFDALYRRHERSQRRRRIAFASAAMAVMVSLAGLAGFALLQKREAVKQRAAAETNERVAKANEAIAREQRTIAEKQAREAQEELSGKLLAEGLDKLSEGMIGEGLAFLRNSLVAWPENRYARDRLLFELSHRGWAETVDAAPIPFDFLSDGRVTDEEEARVGVGLFARDGGVVLRESIGSYDADADTYRVRARESAWTKEGGWVEGKTGTKEDYGSGLSENAIVLPGGVRVFAEPVEAPLGCGDVLAMRGEETLDFRMPGFDGESLSRVFPHGLPLLSPDKGTIAVIGLQEPDYSETERAYGPSGAVHFHFFDAATLVMKEDSGFSYPVAGDADVIRVWWEGQRIAVHTRRDNRAFDQLDVVDFSGGEGRMAVLNMAVTHGLWTYAEGRVYAIARAGGNRVLEVGELREVRKWEAGGESSVSDFVWFADQKREAKAGFDILSADVWEEVGGGHEKVAWLSPESGGGVEGRWQGSGAVKTARILQNGLVEVTESPGDRVIHIPVKVVSGEGGRLIERLGFSPDGAYVVPGGFSAGGGVSDWEILGTGAGKAVFPVVFPRDRQDEIGLIGLYAREQTYGMGALAWSNDGKYLLLGNTDEDLSGRRKELLEKERSKQFDGSYLLRIGFCGGAVPEWFPETVDHIIGIRVSETGMATAVAGEPGKVRGIAATAGGEYGEWLREFLSAN